MEIKPTQQAAVSEELYREYRDALLKGDRLHCAEIVQRLIAEKVGVKDVYLNLFRRSMYEIGELWEKNNISVAKEHLATAITEYLMALTFPLIASKGHAGKTALVACVANEYHQIGGRMVADIFEMNGWDSSFLGANVPMTDLMDLLKEKKPRLVGLSLAIYFNLPQLEVVIQEIRKTDPQVPIIVGGQAFRHGGADMLKRYENVRYIETFEELEELAAD